MEYRLLTMLCPEGRRYVAALEKRNVLQQQHAEDQAKEIAKLRAALEKAFTALQRSPVSRYSQEALRVIRKAREGGDE